MGPWQQQNQGQAQGSNLSGVAARRGEQGGVEVADSARPVEQQVVVGDSAVDYYA